MMKMNKKKKSHIYCNPKMRDVMCYQQVFRHIFEWQRWDGKGKIRRETWGKIQACFLYHERQICWRDQSLSNNVLELNKWFYAHYIYFHLNNYNIYNQKKIMVLKKMCCLFQFHSAKSTFLRINNLKQAFDIKSILFSLKT